MATTGYELVKESIFKEANEVSERLGKEPSNPTIICLLIRAMKQEGYI